MRKHPVNLIQGLSAALALVVAIPLSALAAGPDPYGAVAARADIKATLGFVPGFLGAFPDEAIAGAWSEFKAVQANPKSALTPKDKELIGLAVAAQVPCEYCVYFHTKAAMANGASDREVKEAVAMASIVRHWSTFLNGMRIDEGQFSRELAEVVSRALAPKAPAKEPAPRIDVKDAASARADIAATLGIVPGFFDLFPAEGLPGAWLEFKRFQLNPETALPPKQKELIGLAVAAQIPCHYCVEFHTTVATKLAGAKEAEVREAVAMASIVRHWSTFLNGIQTDRAAFRAEVDRIFPSKTGAR